MATMIAGFDSGVDEYVGRPAAFAVILSAPGSLPPKKISYRYQPEDETRLSVPEIASLLKLPTIVKDGESVLWGYSGMHKNQSNGEPVDLALVQTCSAEVHWDRSALAKFIE